MYILLSRTIFEAHEARVCIADGYVLSDDKRPKPYSPEQYFKTAEAKCLNCFQTFQVPWKTPTRLRNAAMSAYSWVLISYLTSPISDGYTIDTYFEHLSRTGLEERLNHLYPVEKRGEDWAKVRQPYDERIKYEVDIILKMGFPGYFTVVMDFIQWAKNNGVPVGPGRGSGGVHWLLIA